MKKSLVSIVSAAFLVASCGGGGGASGDQGASADLLMDLARDAGFELDESCTRDIAADLSDEDAKAIVEAGVDGTPDISEEGDALGDKIFNECLDAESYAKGLAENLSEEGSVDADCVIAELAGMTVAEIDDAALDAAFKCSGE